MQRTNGWYIAFALICSSYFSTLVNAQDDSTSFEKQISQLYEKRALFKTSQYQDLRKLFADRFQEKYQSEIRNVFGEQTDSILSWLAEHDEFRQIFFTAIDPQKDDIESVLSIFKQLYESDSNAIEQFGQLTIATCVVWDRPRNVYDYRHHQKRTNSIYPENETDAISNFQYLIERSKMLADFPKFLPWEFLVYVVNHKTPLDERTWSIDNYLNQRAQFGKCYADVPYDMGMLNNQTPKLASQSYDLSSIRKFGGVCAMQADFAARVGKSMSLPAEYVTGANAFGGLHAWVMWVEIKQLSENKIRFSLESYGRYNMDLYYTGNIRDPQTGENILDRDMERRLASAGLNRDGKRHADLLMRAFPIVQSQHEMDSSDKLDYLDKVLDLNGYNEEAWIQIAQMTRNGEFSKKQSRLVNSLLNRMFKDFSSYPDFTWKVFDDLVSNQERLKDKLKYYNKLTAMYVQAQRPDLAFEAQLKLSSYQETEEKYEEAADGLANAILAFPNEGRYVPKVLDRLDSMQTKMKNGTALMGNFYMKILPAIVQKRGNRPSDYAVSVYKKAIEFFESSNDRNRADQIRKELSKFYTG